jgi:hypothetical protein
MQPATQLMRAVGLKKWTAQYMKFRVMSEKGKRDVRLITVRRSGTLEDAQHRLLAL